MLLKGVLKFILSMLVVILLVAIQLNIIKATLQNIKHLEISNTTHNKIIIINDMAKVFWIKANLS